MGQRLRSVFLAGYFVVMSVALGSSPVQANEMSVMTLLNGTQLSSEVASVRQGSDANLGLGFGASYEWWLYPVGKSFAPWLTLETGLSYVHREIGYYPETDRITQLQMTAILRRKWRFLSVGLGPYYGKALGGVDSSISGNIPYEQTAIKNTDFGWVAALGFHISPWGTYHHNGHPNVLVEARYLSSLLNVSTDASAEKKFKELQILTGLRFCLGGLVLACTP